MVEKTIDMDVTAHDIQHSTKLTMIDFGNVGKLERRQVKGVIKLSVGLSYKSVPLILSGLRIIVKLNSEQEEILGSFVEDIISKDISSINSMITLIFNKCIIIGAKIAKDITLFFRGKKFIEDQINDLNSKIESKNLTLAKVDIDDIYDKVMKKNIGIDIWWTLGEAQNDEESLIDNEIVFDLVNKCINRVCHLFY